jgi:two-component system LytT family response regulator
MKTTIMNPFSRVITLTGSNATNLVAVHIPGKVLWLAAHEITHLEGEGNYTYIYTRQGKKYLVSKTLKNVQEILCADFLRVHKSFVINPEYITARLDADMLLMSCGQKVPIARRRIREVQEKIAVGYLAVG